MFNSHYNYDLYNLNCFFPSICGWFCSVTIKKFKWTINQNSNVSNWKFSFFPRIISWERKFFLFIFMFDCLFFSFWNKRLISDQPTNIHVKLNRTICHSAQFLWESTGYRCGTSVMGLSWKSVVIESRIEWVWVFLCLNIECLSNVRFRWEEIQEKLWRLQRFQR